MGSTALPVAPTEKPRTTMILRPLVNPAAMIQAENELAELVTKALKPGVDYGVIPGTDKKKKDKDGKEEPPRQALFKAGAERLTKAYGCVAEYPEIVSDIDHDRVVSFSKRKRVYNNAFTGDNSYNMQEEAGMSQGLYSFRVRCRIVLIETGQVVGEGWGSCSTMESKYIDRPRDLENTALKMAQKRAMVAAVLNAFALSDRFTQDLEEDTDPETKVEAEVEATKEEKAPLYELAKEIGLKTAKAFAEFVTSVLGRSFISGAQVEQVRLALIERKKLMAAEGNGAATAPAPATTDRVEKPGETYDAGDAEEPTGGAQ